MKRRIGFHALAWEDYLHWQRADLKILHRINELIRDIQRTPYKGIGKPEALRFDMTGYWSRRINDVHRLMYQVKGDEIIILQCRYHYE